METYSVKQKEYIDSVEGKAHASAVIIIGNLAAEVDRLKAANRELVEACKGVLHIVRNYYHSDDRGPTDEVSIFEDAIKKAEAV